MKYLITGTAGFIGNALALDLLRQGHEVVGIDNVNNYYDPCLKMKRLERLKTYNYEHHFEIPNRSSSCAVGPDSVDCVVHLAAQAGVRYSLENPQSYIDNNITEFLNIMEWCRNHGIKKVFYASSSSVYGNNDKQPFSERDRTDLPANLYAATKKCDEYFAYAYSDLFGIQCIGMRFFTVYGPWGRPDMALFKFVSSIIDNKPIPLYNHGDQARDFTYISDIIDGINILLNADLDKCDVFNIASGKPIQLLEFVHRIEKSLGKTAILDSLPKQAGDVDSTHADITKLKRLGYEPKISISDGIDLFCDWYKGYYGAQ